MSISSNFWKELKKLEEEENKVFKNTTSRNTSGSITSDFFAELNRIDEDIAPTVGSLSSKKPLLDTMAEEKRKKAQEDEEQKRTWFQKGALKDGFSSENIGKAILGTLGDIGENIASGIIGMPEQTLDALSHFGAAMNVANQAQNSLMYDFDIKKYKEEQKYLDEFAEKDLYNEQAIAKKIIAPITTDVGVDTDADSLLGERSDSLVQAASQMLATRGLSAVGVPWQAVTGLTAFGGELENALREGATHEEAGMSAAISAGAEVLSESLFGGSMIGEKGMINLDPITRGISNKLVKTIADWGVDATAEGFEEVVSEVASRLGSALYKEESLKEILTSEEALDAYLESFVGGMALGGIGNIGKAVKSGVKGTDYRSDFNQMEQAVVDKLYEQEVSKKGKLTASEKTKLYESISEKMEKGYITAEDIESVLGGESYTTFATEKDKFFGGETYKSYKENVEKTDDLQKRIEELGKKTDATLMEQVQFQEMRNEFAERRAKRTEQKKALDAEAERIMGLREQMRSEVMEKVKDSRLAETYRELGRKKQKFEVDVNKYQNEHARKTVESILASGLGDNSNQFHDTVEWLASISEQKGVTFDLTKTERLKGTEHYREGYVTNGFKTKNGDLTNITVNLDGNYLNTTVGHEITHVLEEAGVYKELQSVVREFAIAKEGLEGYNKRMNAIKEIYGNNQTMIDSELTADIVGEYLFTDSDFVHSLSTQNRNVFQKVYDEIKYLWNVATAGSKEKRELERVKHIFDKAWQENVKGKPETDSKVQKATKEEAQKEFDEASPEVKETNDDTQYSIRKEAPPTKTEKAYKLMRLVDGELYPLFIGNNEKISVGTWYNADSPNLSQLKDLAPGTHLVNMETGEAITWDEYAEQYVPEKNGKRRSEPNKDDVHWANDNGYRFMYIEDKAGTPSQGRMEKQYGDTRAYYNWGVNGSSKTKNGEGNASKYALRPGWHFGEVPSMHQIGYGGKNEDTFRLDNQVWVEVEMSADVDYNEEAASNWGGDIPTHIPTDGYYKFATNPTAKKTKGGTSEADLTKADWYVAGAFKVNRILSDSEADAIVNEYNQKNGKEVPLDYRRTGGRMFNAETMSIEDGTKYSLSANFPSDAENVAKEYFGTTEKWSETGWLLQDGTQLDFSGRHWERDPENEIALGESYYSGKRNMEHYEIAEAFPELRESSKMEHRGEHLDRFQNRGNIRIVGKGIVAIEKMPTEEQFEKLRSYFGENIDKTIVVGIGRDGLNYKEGTKPSVIIEGIRDYFSRNRRNQSELMRFHTQYSMSKADTDYMDAVFNEDNETAQYLLDEAAKSAGYTIKAYHGTRSGEFFVFDKNRIGDNYSGYNAAGGAFDFSMDEDRAYRWGDMARGLDPIRTIPVYLKAEKTFYNYESVPKDLESTLPDGITETERAEAMSAGYAYRKILEKYGIDFKQAITSKGYDSYSMYQGYENIAVYEPSQIKSADLVTTNPETGEIIPLSERFNSKNDDIRYSVTKDTNGRDLTDFQKDFFKDSKVVDENGSLKVVYHGTASGEFTVFDKTKGSVEGDFGSGFYFTDNGRDVATNYEGGGPDFENKVARLAERIEAEEDIDYDEAEKRAREELFKGSHKFEVYLNIKNPAVVGKTILFDPDEYFGEYDQDDYDSEEDYESDVEQFVSDKISDVIWDVERNVDVYGNLDELSNVIWEAINEGGIGIEELKRKVNDLYLEDSDGNLVGNEVARQIIESLGYDGIIDHTVSTKWNMDMDSGTTHYIAFKPHQVKNVTNEEPTTNPDIRYSMSREEFAPIREDISKMMLEFSKTESEMFTDKLEEQRNGYPNEWRKNRLSSRLADLQEEYVEKGEAILADIDEYTDDQLRGIARRLKIAGQDSFNNVPFTREQFITDLSDKITEYRQNIKKVTDAEVAELPHDDRMLFKALQFMAHEMGYSISKGDRNDSGDWHIDGREFGYHDEFEDFAPIRDDIPTQDENTQTKTPLGEDNDEEETPRPTTRRAYHASIIDRIKATFAERGFDFDDVLNKARNLSTFGTVDNTPQRVMEKSLGYKEGGVLADLTVNQVAQNESEGIKWLNSFTDRKNGLLAQISKQYHIKPGSKESAAAQMYAEGFYVNENNEIIRYGDPELIQDFGDPQVRANIKGLARDPRIRQIYDETLKAINESRARNLYPEIPRLDNYFLHFRAMEDTFSRLGLPFNPNDIRAKDLPTDLNGVTADLKPGQPYFASAMHRTGKRTSFDLLGGLEKYLTSAKNQIYHIDDIQTLRALRNYIADTYGQANGLEDLDSLNEDEVQFRIEQVFNSHLSTFAKFLNEEANIIAGKTPLIDRGIEGMIGRRAITFLNTLNGQVGSNMVGYNISSALTNFLSVAQGFAKTNKADFVKAFAQTVSNKVSSIHGNGDGFSEASPVMIRRKGAERFYRTPWQKMADPGYALMGAVDDISTELIARTKYNEFIRKGMDAQQAHFETDKWVSRLMGDRSLGQMPQLFNSKTLGLITKFQLEVRNQLDSQFYDTIQEAKVSTEDIENAQRRNAVTAAKIGSSMFQMAVVQHLFGKAFESMAGYNPAFDIISVLMTAFGFDDEEEEPVLDNVEEAFMELMDDMPYSSILTGGRIPISSALPIEQFIKGEDQYGNEKSRWETLGEVAPYYLMPGGYGQFKKTVAGLGMFSDEHPISGSYTDSGNLRFPVEDTFGNRAKAAVFGQYASANARDYFDNERSALKPAQIEEYMDLDIPIRDYWEYRDGLKGLDSVAEKADYIDSLDLPISKKNMLINNQTDRKTPIDMTGYGQYDDFEEFDWATKNPEKYNFFNEMGISYKDYKNASEEKKKDYNWAYDYPQYVTLSKAVTDDIWEYREYYKDMVAFKADKDANGKSISGSKKAKVIDYIESLDIDYGAKLVLLKSQYESVDDYNEEIFEYIRDKQDLTFEEKLSILKTLGFGVSDDGRVTWD